MQKFWSETHLLFQRNRGNIMDDKEFSGLLEEE